MTWNKEDLSSWNYILIFYVYSNIRVLMTMYFEIRTHYPNPGDVDDMEVVTSDGGKSVINLDIFA
jgi:hypothetical protein